jgi:hypothetical protein
MRVLGFVGLWLSLLGLYMRTLHLPVANLVWLQKQRPEAGGMKRKHKLEAFKYRSAQKWSHLVSYTLPTSAGASHR